MSMTFAELMRQARADVRELSPGESELAVESGARLIDVRETSEWEEGHIPGAILIPKSYVEQQIEGQVPDRDTPVVLYCAGGVRSLIAGTTLRLMGYTNVASMSGGFQQWKSEGRDWRKPVVLTPAQKQRYSRHLLMPEVGIEGQAKLINSKVLLIGAGGLGAPAMLYLAAAGVGTLGIIDFDVVDMSNLQRQIIHTNDRVGQKKVDSAAETIHALNPETKVITFEEMLGEDNVERIIDGYDVILDGTDTFETRYTLNDAAVRAGIPVVHASVFRFEGQLTVFKPFDGPCYRCLYPTPPPPELAPGCSVAGVLGVVPGTMGILQATEALKLLLEIGEPLIGRLLIYDALDSSFTELKLRRDPHCPACGDGAKDAGITAAAAAPAYAAAQPLVAAR
jgi:sulfur-carrier protein adenylyltransferase/sulfurtransferase